MVEFRKTGADSYGRSFAGDVYNSSVYAKRILGSDIKVSFLTALGTDALSDEMLELWQQQQLDTSLVFRSETATPGAYFISNDARGERQFSYWRGQSAARQTIQLLCDSGQQLAAPKMFYFSGITLAILTDWCRVNLFEIIRQLKSQGCKIVFDPNYRPSLWGSITQAQHWINCAYQSCDMALPGLDDEADLFGLSQPEQILKRLQEFEIEEIVLKAGKLGVHGIANGKTFSAPFASPAAVVDTTAAGDSFDAMYLARRMQGCDAQQAALDAAQAASFVVGFSGAIVPESAFNHFLTNLNSV